MLFTSADYPLFLAAVFFLYALGRRSPVRDGWSWWWLSFLRLAVLVVLGDIVYLLLAKDTAQLWDPIGGPVEYYEKCAQQIKAELEHRVADLDL